VFIKYEAEVSSRVGGGERGVVDFGKLFTETNEHMMPLIISPGGMTSLQEGSGVYRSLLLVSL